MRQLLLFVSILILLLHCRNVEYKICDFKSDDLHLKIYNDVLNELVEQRFYHSYLGAEGDSIFRRYGYFSSNADTARFDEEMIKLQNKIFNDTANFKTIGYHQALCYGPWDYLIPSEHKNDTTKAWNELLNMMTSFSRDWLAVADTLAMVQNQYSFKDFKLCTAKVISSSRWTDADIGTVSFSKIIVNEDKATALFYYEFVCGGKCGMGEIVLVGKDETQWRIKRTYQLWIS